MAKVVVVDDERPVLEVVTAVLESLGHQVKSYAEPLKALDALLDPAAELPRLVVLDVMMPGIDGVELNRRLRADARAKDVPVLVMSSQGEFEGRFRGTPGVVGFVLKPFTLSALRATLQAILAR